ncbi:MAG: hypothetical protein KatS3mg005_1629 [Bryobacteraceae bacterium]|nr:MAG: hypothetical protein KatS3mg005_1629 [Bryobacteraceae bacterium]
MVDQPSALQSESIRGWKEISRYLGVSQRTAQMWEATQGLPVRRTGGPRGSVYALKEDLDAWIRQEHAEVGQARQARALRSRRWRTALAGAGAVALAVAAWLTRHPGGAAAAEIRLEAEAAVGLDEQGRERWRTPLPAPDDRFRADPSRSRWLRVDLDADGRQEFLVVAAMGRQDLPQMAEVERHELVLLDQEGRVRWARTASCRVLDAGGKPFNGSWHVHAWTRAREGRRDRVWLGLGHALRFPGVVAELAPDGALKPLFVNHGHVNALEVLEHNGKRKLLAGGATNALRGGFLAVLDPDAGLTKSPDGGPPRYRMAMEGGAPEAYLLIPAADLTLASGSDVNSVSWLQADGGNGVARAMLGSTACRLYIEFDLPLRPATARLSASCEMHHRQYEQQGLLRHGFDRCPDFRDPLNLQLWTPGHGWTQVQVRLATMQNDL